jgi:hypothetical protein
MARPPARLRRNRSCGRRPLISRACRAAPTAATPFSRRSASAASRAPRRGSSRIARRVAPAPGALQEE